jgi:SMC interacting uncharacterized protein involved in chromosome segregation
MALDIGPYLAPILTAVITAGATYSMLVSRLSRLETRMEQLEGGQMDVHKLSNQIIALSVKLDELKADVAKHNNVVERLYKVENETQAQWKRIDELKMQHTHDMDALKGEHG